jgi:hypothetical protein
MDFRLGTDIPAVPSEPLEEVPERSGQRPAIAFQVNGGKRICSFPGRSAFTVIGNFSTIKKRPSR